MPGTGLMLKKGMNSPAQKKKAPGCGKKHPFITLN
jgi:hypothetical protein